MQRMEASTTPFTPPIATFWTPDHTRITPERMRAFDKLLLLVDDWEHLRETGRRIFFEFLRTKPVLTTEEIDDIRAIADFLAECQACKKAA